MLVLTRKLKQKIQIGKNITITVLRVQGNSVRIGIEAPGDVRILRAELPVDFQDEDTESDSDADVADNSTTALGSPRAPRDFTLESYNPGERAALSRSLPVAAALQRRRSPNAPTSSPRSEHGASVASCGLLARA